MHPPVDYGMATLPVAIPPFDYGSVVNGPTMDMVMMGHQGMYRYWKEIIYL
jgi:hypothetical protein